jgi:Toprim domain
VNAPARSPAPERQAEPNAEQKRNAAWRLWIAATPLRPGDVAWRYLGGRGIGLGQLPRLPGALRTMRGLTYAETGERFPAMLAAVIGPGGKFLTCHRTYLQEHPDGSVTKAQVSSPKKIMGPCRGGLIPLARGASGKPWKRASEGDVLGLCEGIENALSYAVAVPEHRIAAALSVGNLAHVRLPAAISTLIIAADSDAPGSPADRSLRRAIDRFLAEGREVRIARVPEGFKDFNDYLIAEVG